MKKEEGISLRKMVIVIFMACWVFMLVVLLLSYMGEQRKILEGTTEKDCENLCKPNNYFYSSGAFNTITCECAPTTPIEVFEID